MILELCAETGWSFNDVWRMPMTRFGMFLGHARKRAEDKFNRLLFEMTDVAAVSTYNAAYHHALRDHYKMRLMNEVQVKKRANPRLFDVADKEQADNAALIIASALRTKKRLMGIERGR